MKTERQKLIKQADDIFREIIRNRDKLCQRTQKNHNLQVAHFFTRGHLSSRWDKNNACLLNAGEHLYWAHSHAEEFRDWWIKRIGEYEFERLKMRNSYSKNIPTWQIKIIRNELQKELEMFKRPLENFWRNQ